MPCLNQVLHTNAAVCGISRPSKAAFDWPKHKFVKAVQMLRHDLMHEHSASKHTQAAEALRTFCSAETVTPSALSKLYCGTDACLLTIGMATVPGNRAATKCTDTGLLSFIFHFILNMC